MQNFLGRSRRAKTKNTYLPDYNPGITIDGVFAGVDVVVVDVVVEVVLDAVETEEDEPPNVLELLPAAVT